MYSIICKMKKITLFISPPPPLFFIFFIFFGGASIWAENVSLKGTNELCYRKCGIQRFQILNHTVEPKST